ncbi:MAG: fused MFS/spermidine synthase, partial [Micavibrio aeruginosavorus]|nr:fused MFS/spermidine synthase [Micavibrio aeruginosavorus]
AASNFGSLAALIAYPLLIEVFLGTRMQAGIWTWLYGGLIAMLILCAALTGKKRIVETINATGPAVTNGQRLVWTALAFIPSSLLLSVTTYITTDIASAPLFWIIPLTLYLITFIMAFARRQMIGLSTAYLFFCALMTIVAMLFVKGIFGASLYPMAIHLALFFLAALCAHTALSQRKPAASHLTEFYLYISLGGVLGGMFNTFIAPAIFPVPFEYPLGLAAALLTPFLATGIWPQAAELKKNALILLSIAAVSVAAIFLGNNLALIMLSCVLVLAGLMILLDREAKTAFIAAICVIFLTHPSYDWSAFRHTLLVERNFFGVSRVADSADKPLRTYLHGTTIHGAQALTEQDRLTPLTYYAPHGPAGDAFALLSAPGPQKIAVLGLGAGSVACYAKEGRFFDFYEIDPIVIRVAEDPKLFTYLSDCGSPYRNILGDGRLKIAEAPDRGYDMIFLDAFSSDSIPVHIVTREAFTLYFSKLKDDGFLLINISNRHLDLAPLLARMAQEFGAEIRYAYFKGEPVSDTLPGVKSLDARYVIITRNPDIIARLTRGHPRWQELQGKTARLWTDDYANIISLFKK